MIFELQRGNNMKITTVLFDLDGTLLPMDNDVFTKGYFGLIVKKLAPYGYGKDELVSGIWKATAAMVANNGSCSNCDVFWKAFAGALGERVYDDRAVFDDFYLNEFNQAKAYCGSNAAAADIVGTVRRRGLRTALASNPIFPMTAQKARLEWAGIDPDAFELITSYENSSSCKPNPEYYAEIARRLGVSPEECLMVGNDVYEDTAAEKAGMSVFLLTDNLINRDNKDISGYHNGSFGALKNFLMQA